MSFVVPAVGIGTTTGFIPATIQVGSVRNNINDVIDVYGIGNYTYENYNTHEETDGFDANLAYDRTDKTFGLTYKLNQGAAFKADYQLKGNEASPEETKHFNLGVAVWF